MRKNGWQAPFHVLQVLTWVVFPSIMAMFFAFSTPLLEETGAYIGTVVYAVLCIITIYSVVVCTATDPSDDCILRPSAEGRPTVGGEDQVYCNVCMQYVHKESRHCRLCDKCVAVFDHHCKWLNNCVGKKNYRYFLGSVIGASTLMAVQIGFGIFLLWESFDSPKTIRRRSATAYGCSISKDDATGLCTDGDYAVSLIAIRVIHICLLSFLVPWCFMIGQLTLFHFHLCYENITTYDYIVRQRKRKMARDRENLLRVPWWQKLYLRLCCRTEHPTNDDRKASNKTASRLSGLSLQSEEDENYVAITQDVDDELEVISNHSGEISDRDSTRRSSQPRASRNSLPPTRGFGLHVNLGVKKKDGDSTPVLMDTPSSISETSYLQAPDTPGLPDTPRSEGEAAYRSSEDKEEPNHQPLSAIPFNKSSSMIMYGRPPAERESPASHIV